MINFLQIPAVPAENINVADSLKVVKEAVITQIKEDPDTFFQKLGDDALQLGTKVVIAIVIYIIGAWLIKKLRISLKKLFTRRKIDASMASFLISLITATLYIILILISVSTLGINTNSIVALLAAGGMAIGMALSGTVQNFAGGIMLMVFKPFKAGDFITAQGYSGTVTEVTIVNTKITTVDNKVIIIPNGALSSGNIENFSALPLRRVDWSIDVEYGSDATKCIEAIKEILAEDKRILDVATPGASDVFVALSNLDSSDINFTVRAWVRNADYWNVYFENLQKLYTQLPARGFSFAYPHMDVRMVENTCQ